VVWGASVLNSWLDRLLLLLALSTLVLTVFALQYMWESSTPAPAPAPTPEVSAPPPTTVPPPAPEPPADPGLGFAKAGMNALDAGDTAAAVRLLERAVQASPNNVEWRRLLADAYRLNGDALRASEEGLRALELTPAEAPARAND